MLQENALFYGLEVNSTIAREKADQEDRGKGEVSYVQKPKTNLTNPSTTLLICAETFSMDAFTLVRHANVYL